MDLAKVPTPKNPYPDASESEFESMDAYITHAKKIICHHAPRIKKGLKDEILYDDEALSYIATAIMMADWTYDEERVGKSGSKCTLRTYRTNKAIWAMKSYMTRQTRKSEQNLSLNFELRDSEIELYSTIQDKNLKTPTQIAQDKELRKFIEKIISSSLLSKMQGKYVRLRFLKGLTVREIAEISGKSRQGVGESLKKAILKIQHSDFQYEYKTRFC